MGVLALPPRAVPRLVDGDLAHVTVSAMTEYHNQRVRELEAELEQVKKERDEWERVYVRDNAARVARAEKAEAERDRLVKERDEALHAEDVAERYREAAVADRDRLAETVRLLLDGPDPHGAETERIARAALASMEGDK